MSGSLFVPHVCGSVWKGKEEEIQCGHHVKLHHLYRPFRSIFQQDDGGLHGVDDRGAGLQRPETYFFGIIDILQEFNLRKQLEYSFKSVIHPKVEEQPSPCDARNAWNQLYFSPSLIVIIF